MCRRMTLFQSHYSPETGLGGLRFFFGNDHFFLNRFGSGGGNRHYFFTHLFKRSLGMETSFGLISRSRGSEPGELQASIFELLNRKLNLRWRDSQRFGYNGLIPFTFKRVSQKTYCSFIGTVKMNVSVICIILRKRYCVVTGRNLCGNFYSNYSFFSQNVSFYKRTVRSFHILNLFT